MTNDDEKREERHKELNHIQEIADGYYFEHGKFPSRIRVGDSVWKQLSPAPRLEVIILGGIEIIPDTKLDAEEIMLDP